MLKHRIRIERRNWKPKKVKAHVDDSRWDYPILKDTVLKEGAIKFNNRFAVLTSGTRKGELWYFKNDKSKEPLKTSVVVKGSVYSPAPHKRKFCIMVDMGGRKKFYFAAKDKSKYFQWMIKLFEAGGVYRMDYYEGLDLMKLPVFKFPYTFVDLFDAVREKIVSGGDGNNIGYIFTKDGNEENVEKIIETINDGEATLEFYKQQKAIDLCDAFKRFLKTLPNSILSDDIIEELLEAYRNPNKRKYIIKKVREIFAGFEETRPSVCGLFVREFFSLLNDVTKYASRTKQTPKKLCFVLIPLYFRKEEEEEVPAHIYDKVVAIMSDFIKNYAKYFGEVQVQVQNHQKIRRSRSKVVPDLEEEEEEEEVVEEVVVVETEVIVEEEEEDEDEVKIRNTRKKQPHIPGRRPKGGRSTGKGKGREDYVRGTASSGGGGDDEEEEGDSESLYKNVRSLVGKLQSENRELKSEIRDMKSQMKKVLSENNDLKREIMSLKNRN